MMDPLGDLLFHLVEIGGTVAGFFSKNPGDRREARAGCLTMALLAAVAVAIAVTMVVTLF